MYRFELSCALTPNKHQTLRLFYIYAIFLFVSAIYTGGNSCHPVLFRVNISVVCLVFRISSTTILSTFETVTIINRCAQTVLLHAVYINFASAVLG